MEKILEDYFLFEIQKTDDIRMLVDMTKSDSGISGPELAKAHIRLGELLGEHIHVDPQQTTIVAIMRGGIFFAEGLYFSLGCKFMTYDPKHEAFHKPDTDEIILVDSVINTGTTIKKIWEDGMKVACCVINRKSVDYFDDCLCTVRVSDNSYIGADVKAQNGNTGPDTTMRLFNYI